MQQILNQIQVDQSGEPGASTPQKGRPAWLAAVQLGAFLCLGVLSLEAFFNLSGVGNEEFLEPDRTFGVKHIPGKKVVWRLEGYSDEHLSKQGLRDTEHAISKAEGTYRIVLLGDSATEGMQVQLKDTYGKQLEQLLNSSGKMKKNVEVINFGCSSYSNGQETLQLEQQVRQFKPDLVVMMYNRGDYIENIRDPNTMKAEPRPYFHLDANNNLLQDNTIMDFNKSAFEPHPVIAFLRNNSRIYGVLNHTNLALSLNEQLYSKMRNSLLKMLPGTKEQWKRTAAPYVIQDPWKVSEAIINRAKADCDAQNAKFMVVCFPNNVNEKEYAKQISNLKTQAKNQGFMYLDLTPDYVNASDPKSLFLKYHFSSAGHSVAANKIGQTIIGSN